MLTALSAEEGFKLLEQHADEIGLLLTDQRMPGQQGVWLLERARHFRPRIVRILVTAFTDPDAMIAAINSGAISKFIIKPWDPPQLEIILRQSLEFFMVQSERDSIAPRKALGLAQHDDCRPHCQPGPARRGPEPSYPQFPRRRKDLSRPCASQDGRGEGGLERPAQPDFWMDYHQNVQSQIGKINNLLTDLRTSADRNAATQFADEVSLGAAVGAALKRYGNEFAARNIEVDNQIPDSLPVLQADRDKFYRLFELLLKDELAILPVGSKISLSAELQETGAKPEIVLQITDNGPGLPQEALSVIFDPFVTTTTAPSEYGINLMACFLSFTITVANRGQEPAGTWQPFHVATAA